MTGMVAYLASVLHLLLGEGADHNAVAVAGEDPGGVLHRLAPADLAVLAGQEQMAWPPSWYMPVSKETRVRVEFFSKIMARVLPWPG